MSVKLREKPFYLDDEQAAWVEETLAHMTMDEKIGQIFCPSISMFSSGVMRHYTHDLKIGSMMLRPFHVKGLQDNIRKLQNMSKYPMLISANLENGGSGAITEGTLFANPMGCAATKNPENGYRLGKVIPRSVESGADVILFNRSIEEDITYMKLGLKEGIVSETRINEAAERVLALKAMLNLHKKKEDGTIVPSVDPMQVINRQETKAWTKECADEAVTLVKDTRKILPLSPEKTKRIYLNVIENHVTNRSAFAADIKARLEREGFEVTLRKRKLDLNPTLLLKGIPTPKLLHVLKEIRANTDEFVSKYDLCLIVVNMETVSNATVVRIDWKVLFGLGNDIPWYAGELPLVVVSTANPYHLLDIPMAHAYINAYTGNKETLDAVFDKMMGRSEFKGVSPVDAFCGHEDCRL